MGFQGPFGGHRNSVGRHVHHFRGGSCIILPLKRRSPQKHRFRDNIVLRGHANIAPLSRPRFWPSHKGQAQIARPPGAHGEVHEIIALRDVPQPQTRGRETGRTAVAAFEYLKQVGRRVAAFWRYEYLTLVNGCSGIGGTLNRFWVGF